jgi:DNA-binding CsgD family transcriptional regulator/tetratricopeptide (TPR) repeat protein
VISEELDDPYHLAQALQVRGVSHLRHGHDELAQADWERALPLLQAEGDQPCTARVLLYLSNLERRRGHHDQRRSLIEDALALARACEAPTVIAYALSHLGEVAEEFGDDDLAAACYRERMAFNRELGMPWSIAVTLEHLARLSRKRGAFERAACMLAGAAVLRERSGSPFVATGGFDIADDLDAIRDALSDDVFQSAWARGRAMTTEEAVQYALQDDEDPAHATGSPTTTLTRRELDVLRLLVDGQSNHEIASVLFISPNTVNTHVANIMNKLGLDSRTAVATWAVRNGFA